MVLGETMIAVLRELQGKALLDQTLVVLGTEFGRTREVDDNDGREVQVLARAPGTPTPTTSKGRRFSRP